jgi:hypothetical protein
MTDLNFRFRGHGSREHQPTIAPAGGEGRAMNALVPVTQLPPRRAHHGRDGRHDVVWKVYAVTYIRPDQFRMTGGAASCI